MKALILGSGQTAALVPVEFDPKLAIFLPDFDFEFFIRNFHQVFHGKFLKAVCLAFIFQLLLCWPF